MVSIGPFHHGKPELEPMEKLKIPIVQQFIKDSGKPDHVFYNEFVKMAGYARPFYAEGSTTNFNDQDFAIVMFLDGQRSATKHSKHVEFKAYAMHGELSLPPINIGEFTKAKFLNLMAYENCPDTPDDKGVTSYVYFMRALIANDHDVKKLRSQGILQNFLIGDDEQVVDLFKQLATGAAIDVLIYGSVKGQIESIATAT
ncbi:hypothetical protein HHK36_017224 [Tetracentron sinense]|uniref:Uncharacterized protein n=1 Tax=Tetracentron sinense TaxID=13715 RepID=A0A835DF02_TETSI|nr:hypothetical protein HHK36_017224 [Tetracentron sinense]